MVKVSKEQKEDIEFLNEVIQGFFEAFTERTETIYFKWQDNVRIGDVVDYMIRQVNKSYERAKRR